MGQETRDERCCRRTHVFMANKYRNALALRRANLAVPSEVIERRIYLIRGQKAMLDADLARL